MIGYVTIGVSDMAKAVEFYSGLLGEIGGKEIFGMDRIKFFGTKRGEPMFAICIPYDKAEQNCGNGNMISILGGDRAGVDKLCNKTFVFPGRFDRK